MEDLNTAVIPAPNDENFQKLIDTSNLDKHVRFLTKDTGSSISQTFNSLVELSIHLLRATHEYAILGHFTSDPRKRNLKIEDRGKEELTL